MNDKTGKQTASQSKASDAPEPPPQAQLGAGPKVVWDDSNMSSSFANVVNVLATREEMTLLFGANQTWNAQGSDELVVRLSDRIVLSPFAAKRLSILLERRVKEYEARFGKLET
ncbi:DUF3467 domain-containing protein [Roseisalinus antarcticus]|uniref:DUF3467 domain-containing protein n=1 Tax=Roseisalinus antarcticus TaxID=254357 RepID=A0A1Y5TFV9_9RHOB|nr:DUF3467 domain-containing protein [Roseisalinus antarcticus]SLN63122.1 hypothetical protein ROA7023_02955 [Roseisalinus antarcticus]